MHFNCHELDDFYIQTQKMQFRDIGLKKYISKESCGEKKRHVIHSSEKMLIKKCQWRLDCLVGLKVTT